MSRCSFHSFSVVSELPHTLSCKQRGWNIGYLVSASQHLSLALVWHKTGNISFSVSLPCVCIWVPANIYLRCSASPPHRQHLQNVVLFIPLRQMNDVLNERMTVRITVGTNANDCTNHCRNECHLLPVESGNHIWSQGK